MLGYGCEPQRLEYPPVKGVVVRDDRLAQLCLKLDFQMNKPLRLSMGARAEVAHAVGKISVCIGSLLGDISHGFGSQIPIKTPNRSVAFFL